VQFSGFLEKRGQLNTAWKKRWCIIRDDKLYYYKSKENNKPAGVISLQQAVVRVRAPPCNRLTGRRVTDEVDAPFPF
jgi:hypothetical protein